jgi:hypothetical protein
VESSNDLKIQVFWDMMLLSTGGYHHSKETCTFHPQRSARGVGYIQEMGALYENGMGYETGMASHKWHYRVEDCTASTFSSFDSPSSSLSSVSSPSYLVFSFGFFLPALHASSPFFWCVPATDLPTL